MLGLALAFRAQPGAHRSDDRELPFWHVVATDERLPSHRDRAAPRRILGRVAVTSGPAAYLRLIGKKSRPFLPSFASSVR